jgi:hypothetical protein
VSACVRAVGVFFLCVSTETNWDISAFRSQSIYELRTVLDCIRQHISMALELFPFILTIFRTVRGAPNPPRACR